ncbi:MAG: glycosyltransferase family 4 protein [Flavobacterium sp.]|uniref:glycosyltransferase family 4 protein n=1 Tax=Flavobacterium sp. TaxID=239 RepID=UPI003BBDB79F
MNKPKLVRVTTVPISLDKLLHGQLRFMSAYYEVIALSSDEEYLSRVGDREGVRTFPLEMSRKITPITDLLAIIKLFFFLRKEKPFIVHSHTPKAGLVTMIAANLARVPIRLHTVAGLPLMETTGIKRVILNLVEKLTYACATKIYPNSIGLKDIIVQEKFCTSSKLKVLGNGSSNGIDIGYFDPELFTESQNLDLRQSLNIGTSDFVFIFVGRLVSDKGINEMVAAFASHQILHPQSKLLLVGDYEADLDPLTPITLEAIQNNSAILTTGFQADVRPYFALANALIFPSYREGFPNVVMQAGAMGLPCIVTNINGCNEIINEGINGVIVSVKNTVSLLLSMNEFVENSQLFYQLQTKSRSMIATRYNQQVIWEAIKNEYDQLKVTLY